MIPYIPPFFSYRKQRRFPVTTLDSQYFHPPTRPGPSSFLVHRSDGSCRILLVTIPPNLHPDNPFLHDTPWWFFRFPIPFCVPHYPPNFIIFDLLLQLVLPVFNFIPHYAMDLHSSDHPQTPLFIFFSPNFLLLPLPFSTGTAS